MKEKLDQMKALVQTEIKHITTMEELEAIKIQILGKKGSLTNILKGMGKLSPEERPVFGKIANETRLWIENTLSQLSSQLGVESLKNQLELERIDVTIPGRKIEVGHKHPMSIIIDELSTLFMGMGFSIAEGPDIETDYYNFEALNIPANHPAKDEQDTFYINEHFLLRTQTSPMQIRVMESQTPPIRIICPGKVFRSDHVDATHSPVFHQLEGLLVDEGVTMSDLKGILEEFVKELLGPDVKTRFRPHHFPFTEPSAELDVTCVACHGAGCSICKNSGFIEMLGCGMVHPKVLENAGIDSKKYAGFAFGMGLERIAMQRFSITDMRLLFENDIRFLSNF